jgi:hypothetical protein
MNTHRNGSSNSAHSSLTLFLLKSTSRHTVWKDDCRSWYKNNETGRVNAVWPGSSLHYMDIITSPRYEDFEITYHNKNPWAFLGMGHSLKNRDKKDWSPYLALENCDPKWQAAVGAPVSSTGQKKRKMDDKSNLGDDDKMVSWDGLTDGSISV